MTNIRTLPIVRLLCIGGAALVATGCAPAAAQRPAASAMTGAVAGSITPVIVPQTPPQNVERLTALHAHRTGESRERDYMLGPGDLLAVKAFDFDELNQRVRVAGDGKITLPLLETVAVGGRTLAEVQHDLTTRLGEYMYDPHVTVFVEEYRSQQVAVVGAVQRPGLVSQSGRGATVLDAISSAGGLTGNAGSRIYLIPAEDRAAPEADLAAVATRAGAAATPAAVGPPPIVVDTKDFTNDAQRLLFSLPARGGDVVVVPPAGHFIAEGWVEKPGTYPLQPGLTLRGAIAAAGGLSFPAESSHLRVIRSPASGMTQVLEANLDDISAQRAPDIVLQEGDVIEVASSKAKLVSWGAYETLTKILHVGARLPLIP